MTTCGSSRSPAMVTPSAPGSTWAATTTRCPTPGCPNRNGSSTRRAGSVDSSSRCGSTPTNRWWPASTAPPSVRGSPWRWRPTSAAPPAPAWTAKTDRRRCEPSSRRAPLSSGGADVPDRATQQQEAVDEFLDLLRHERQGGNWVGRTPDGWGPVVFGGVGLALTISAACSDAPPNSRLHSLHAHFLRPVLGGRDIVFHTDVLKAGRTFSLHVVTATQNDKPAITMTCSFTADTDGYVYDLSGLPDDTCLPDELPEPEPSEYEPAPWHVRWLGPSELRADGTREATHRHW